MLTIHLHDIELKGFHGLYPEEKIKGNHFIVQLELHLRPTGKISHLEQTVDYAKAYEILFDIFQQPHELLETLAQDILWAIFSFDRKIEAAQIIIVKQSPPIKNFTGNTGVTMLLERADMGL